MKYIFEFIKIYFKQIAIYLFNIIYSSQFFLVCFSLSFCINFRHNLLILLIIMRKIYNALDIQYNLGISVES